MATLSAIYADGNGTTFRGQWEGETYSANCNTYLESTGGDWTTSFTLGATPSDLGYIQSLSASVYAKLSAIPVDDTMSIRVRIVDPVTGQIMAGNTSVNFNDLGNVTADTYAWYTSGFNWINPETNFKTYWDRAEIQVRFLHTVVNAGESLRGWVATPSSWVKVTGTYATKTVTALEVAASGDDFWDNGTTFDTNDANLTLGLVSGLTCNGGMAFAAMPIPPRAIPNTFTISMIADDTNTTTPHFHIYGVLGATAPTTHAGFLALTKTTAFVEWTPASWSAGVEYATPDLSTIVSEIVNHSSWSSAWDEAAGAKMIFVINYISGGAGYARYPSTYDHSTDQAPHVDATWTAPEDAYVAATDISRTATVGTPTVKGGSRVTATAISRTSSVSSATRQYGGKITATAIARTASIPASTVEANSEVDASAISRTAAVISPALIKCGAGVTATTISRTATVSSPATIKCGARATVTAISAIATVSSATRQYGGKITATAISRTAATSSTTVKYGASATLATISRTASIPAIVRIGLGHRVIATALAATASVPTPTTSLNGSTSPTAISCTGTVPNVTVKYGARPSVSTITAPAATSSASVKYGGKITATPIQAILKEILVSNGSGELGDNTGWTGGSGLTYDAGDSADDITGSFKSSYAYGAEYTDYTIPIPDPSAQYQLKYAAKWDGVGTQPSTYGMLICQDADGNIIQPYDIQYFLNTETTLAAPLSPGDTTITLTSSANWHNGSWEWARYIGLWPYTNTQGYTYPDGSYTKHVGISTPWAEGGITGNVITLTAPWAGPNNPNDEDGIWPIGTVVRNHYSGSTFTYLVLQPTPTSWTTYTGYVQGFNTYGEPDNGLTFRQGTVKVNVGWLLNYSPGGPTTWVDAVEFSRYPVALPQPTVTGGGKATPAAISCTATVGTPVVRWGGKITVAAITCTAFVRSMYPATAFSWTVAAADDYFWSNDELLFSTTEPYLLISSYDLSVNTGLRFLNPGIAQGTAIRNATITLKCLYPNDSDSAYARIFGNAVDSATVPGSAVAAKALVLTTAYADWEVPNWTYTGEPSSTPNISAILTEIFDRPGYALNNPIQILIKNTELVETYLRYPSAVEGGYPAILSGDTAGVQYGASVTVTAISCAATLPSTTVKTGAGVAATTVSCPVTIPAPTVRYGGKVTVTAINKISTVVAPTRIGLGRTVSASSISCVASLNSVTVKYGGRITVTSITRLSSVYTVTLGLGGRASPTSVNTIATVPAVTARWGGRITATTITRTAVTSAATIKYGGKITVATINTTATTPAVTVRWGGRATVTAISATTIIPTVEITANFNTTVEPDPINCAATVPSPTIKWGASVSAGNLPALTTIPTPVIQYGARPTVTAINTTAATPASTVRWGGKTSPASINGTASLPAVTVQWGGKITATTMSRTSTVPTVERLGLGKTVTATTISRTSTVTAATVQYGGKISPLSITRLATTYEVTPGGNGRAEPEPVSCTTTISSPTVQNGYQITVTAVTGTATVTNITAQWGAKVSANTISRTSNVSGLTVQYGCAVSVTATGGVAAIPAVTVIGNGRVEPSTITAPASLPSPAALNIGSIVSATAITSIADYPLPPFVHCDTILRVHNYYGSP